MELNFKDYEEAIKDSVAKYIRDMNPDGIYTELTLGLYEEASEVIAPIRKSIEGNYHEKEIDLSHLGEEIGDVLWYISQIVTKLPNCDLQQIAFKNLKKIHKNYLKQINIGYPISFTTYINGVQSTYWDNLPGSKDLRARVFCLGLIKETGKVAELFGEHVVNGNVLDIYKVEEKLGDALWYLTAISETYGLNLEQIASESIKKVHSRYKSDGTVILSAPSDLDGQR